MNKELLDKIKKINIWAEKLGYDKFTDLQRNAFSKKEAFDFEKWLFIIGATSSGKTLIPILLFFNTYFERLENGEKCKMLFAVPYRALAIQKKEEIEEIVKNLNVNLNIVISTGELKADDGMIMNGLADIVILIYEKVYTFTGTRGDFLINYDYIIMDEIGLIQDYSRGIKIDFILAKAKVSKNLRVIALGTPFFDWQNYVEGFGFYEIREEKRPVKFETYPIFYDVKKINHVCDNCVAVKEEPFHLIKNDIYDINPKQKIDQIIEEICKYHLSNNHKILIIENNKGEVRNLAQRLSVSLFGDNADEEKIKTCKEYVEGRVGKDELYGVMEENDYKTLSNGIGYHHADIPIMLRKVVEEQFFSPSGNLKIVCSTETLVYGINSATDVVIIPHMKKQRTDGNEKYTFLSSNEYMNYIGRAGRICASDHGEWSNKKGYVYPFIKAEYIIDNDITVKSDKRFEEKFLWDDLQREIKNPKKISSNLYKLKMKDAALYLLNLFPFGNTSNCMITKVSLQDMLQMIPIDSDEERMWDIDTVLVELINRKLVCGSGAGDINSFTKFYLSNYGRKLAGYIIPLEDYDYLMENSYEYISNDRICEFVILYRILECPAIMKNIRQSIPMVNEDYHSLIENILYEIIHLHNSVADNIVEELNGKIKHKLVKLKNFIKKGQYGNIVHDKEFNKIRVIAAVIMWKDDVFSVKKIYDKLGINYAQMKRIAEQISFYIDILQIVFPLSNYSIKSAKRDTSSIDIDEIQLQIKMLSDGIYYRVPPRMLQFLNIQCYDPYTAAKIREVTKLYDDIGKIMKKRGKKYNKELVESIKEKVESLQEEWRVAFYKEFKEVLTNED